jgi:Ca2+-binding RTX toxin-like protein
MFARAGADIVNGLFGDDTLRGLIGVDTMSDEDGNDAVYGGRRNDRLLGGLGTDVLSGVGDPLYAGSGAVAVFVWGNNRVAGDCEDIVVFPTRAAGAEDGI